ncbi:MAG: prenyltransferase/squalene oxidase repeat-containing protein [Planctomycetota bacterium]
MMNGTLLWVVLALFPQAEEGEPLEVQVNRTIDLTVKKLFAEQALDGTWGWDDKVHPTGRTALALLALLHAGLPASDPAMTRGIDVLIGELRRRRATLEGGEAAYRSTYETGVTLMLLYALGTDPRFVEEMQPLVDFLARNLDRGQHLHAYPEGTADLSNTQYALLGLRSASLREVRPKRAKAVWADALKGILECHNPDGGFSYRPNEFSTGSMTVAGLAMIQLCQEELKGYGGAAKDLIEAKKAVKAGEKWLEDSFTVRFNVHGRSLTKHYFHYYLYGLERYAVFYGKKLIGGHDWYREGAEYLIRLQNDDGSFGGTEQTCFALLLLRKAALTMPSVRDGRLANPRRDDNPRLEAERRIAPPRADVEFLRNWLVAGPYPGRKMDDDHLQVEHIQEQKAVGIEGRRAGRCNWKKYESPEDQVDLLNAGVADVDTATYAFCWLDSEQEQDVVLHLASDDGIRVILNGELVFEDHHHDGKDDMRVELKLPEGRSRLLLKVENTVYYCHFRARIADLDGKPVPEVQASLKRG